jgi:hypothetical protein
MYKQLANLLLHLNLTMKQLYVYMYNLHTGVTQITSMHVAQAGGGAYPPKRFSFPCKQPTSFVFYSTVLTIPLF